MQTGPVLQPTTGNQLLFHDTDLAPFVGHRQLQARISSYCEKSFQISDALCVTHYLAALSCNFICNFFWRPLTPSMLCLSIQVFCNKGIAYIFFSRQLPTKTKGFFFQLFYHFFFAIIFSTHMIPQKLYHHTFLQPQAKQIFWHLTAKQQLPDRHIFPIAFPTVLTWFLSFYGLYSTMSLFWQIVFQLLFHVPVFSLTSNKWA